MLRSLMFSFFGKHFRSMSSKYSIFCRWTNDMDYFCCWHTKGIYWFKKILETVQFGSLEYILLTSWDENSTFGKEIMIALVIRYHNRGCAHQRIFFETIQSIESILTQFWDINMWCQNVSYIKFQKTKDDAQPRKFWKNRTIWHYLENISTNILRWYFMLNC